MPEKKNKYIDYGDRGRYNSNNKVNDLTGKEWIKFSKSWFVHRPPRRKEDELLHPAKFPESLIEEFISFFTKEGEWVLDPFMGSGSAGVVCMELGVNFIGFEINKDYFEVAENQISAAKSQGAMFRHLTPRAVDLRDSPALPGLSQPEG